MSGSDTNSRAGTSRAAHARKQLLDAVPLDEQHHELAGIPTSVLVGGEGPPMVLLHGPGELALTWLRVMPSLTRSHRVVAPDLPGHGASGLGDGALDEGRVMAWLDELVSRTCPTSPSIAGHLLGGAVAARFAAEHPDRVHRLFLVDTFGLRRLRPSPMFALTMLGFLARPTDASRDRFFDYCFVDQGGLRTQLGPLWAPLMTCALEGARSPAQKAALRSMLPGFGWRPLPEETLAGIEAPTTLVWGRHDLQTPVAVAERASARYGWPLQVIDGCADDPAVEQPEAVLEVLTAAA